MLVSKNAKISFTPNAKHKICVTPNAKPQREPMEYRLHGSPTQNFRVGHVHFVLFVLISFALLTQRKPSLQWNMGFRFKLDNVTILWCMPLNGIDSYQWGQLVSEGSKC